MANKLRIWVQAPFIVPGIASSSTSRNFLASLTIFWTSAKAELPSCHLQKTNRRGGRFSGCFRKSEHTPKDMLMEPETEKIARRKNGIKWSRASVMCDMRRRDNLCNTIPRDSLDSSSEKSFFCCCALKIISTHEAYRDEMPISLQRRWSSSNSFSFPAICWCRKSNDNGRSTRQ